MKYMHKSVIQQTYFLQFALLLTLVLILEVSASIAAYAMRANIRVFMKDKMEIAMKGYLTDAEYKDAVDFLQMRVSVYILNKGLIH